jgi:NADPH:quinone reductase-like Zn-dependent oxidoreductase
VAAGVNVVFNFASADLRERSYGVLKPGGRYVTTVEIQLPPDEAGIRNFGVAASPTIDSLTSLARMIDEGKVKVLVDRTFPVHQVETAIGYRMTSTAPGKIVLNVSNGW